MELRIQSLGIIVLALFIQSAGAADYQAVGDYVQDTDVQEQVSDFYDRDMGLYFEGWRTYEKGDFTLYSWTGDNASRAQADLLIEGTYQKLGYGSSAPHDMKEVIYVDSSKIYYYEDGLNDDKSETLDMAIIKGATYYKVNTDFIPLWDIYSSGSSLVDKKYNGKIPFFGEEYYVKDFVGTDTLYLAKGQVLTSLTSSTFNNDYKSYKFKIDHLIYDGSSVSGMVLQVLKPDASIVQVQISKTANGIVDNLELSGIPASASALSGTSVIAYDLSSQAVLQDGEDLSINGQVKTDWAVSLERADSCQQDYDCEISQYGSMISSTGSLLKSARITYQHDLDGDEALQKGESLLYPKDFRITFKGFMRSNYKESLCSGSGQGYISLGTGNEPHEVVLNLTGEDGLRYNNIRMDVGPFKTNDLFMLFGMIYKYYSHEKQANDIGSTDDTIDVSLEPQIRGNLEKITGLQRYCNDKDAASPSDETYTHLNCGDLPDIKLRELSLTQALKADATVPITSSDYEKDKEITISADRLYIKKSAINLGGGRYLDLLFDDGDNRIFFSTNADYNSMTQTLTDPFLYINQYMVGSFNDFQVNGYHLDFSVINEGDLTSDPNFQSYNVSKDKNKDGNDDDTLLVFDVTDGPVILDLSDRSYNSDIDSRYRTDIVLDQNYNYLKDGDDIEVDDSTDALLITPQGGDGFLLDWGTDDKLRAISICHPKERVYATYFIGTYEGTANGTTTTTTTTSSTTTTTQAGECTITGDTPPCGTVELTEVITGINDWATGQMSLQEIITLINAWASG